jgi:hypothetical protein
MSHLGGPDMRLSAAGFEVESLKKSPKFSRYALAPVLVENR